MKYKILITGVYGFLGSKLYKKLNKVKNFQVLGIGRNKYKKKFKNSISGAITNQNLNSLKFIPDIIIHCAGEGSIKNVTRKHGS